MSFPSRLPHSNYELRICPHCCGKKNTKKYYKFSSQEDWQRSVQSASKNSPTQQKFQLLTLLLKIFCPNPPIISCWDSRLLASIVLDLVRQHILDQVTAHLDEADENLKNLRHSSFPFQPLLEPRILRKCSCID